MGQSCPMRRQTLPNELGSPTISLIGLEHATLCVSFCGHAPNTHWQSLVLGGIGLPDRLLVIINQWIPRDSLCHLPRIRVRSC